MALEFCLRQKWLCFEASELVERSCSMIAQRLKLLACAIAAANLAESLLVAECLPWWDHVSRINKEEINAWYACFLHLYKGHLHCVRENHTNNFWVSGRHPVWFFHSILSSKRACSSANSYDNPMLANELPEVFQPRRNNKKYMILTDICVIYNLGNSKPTSTVQPQQQQKQHHHHQQQQQQHAGLKMV